jgi:hypothetical protein
MSARVGAHPYHFIEGIDKRRRRGDFLDGDNPHE